MNGGFFLMYKRLFIIVPLVLLSACTKQVELQTYANIDSIPNGFSKGSSFFIFTDPKNEQFLAKETSRKISYLLKDQGYCIADKHSAQYYLFFNYDLEAEKRIVRVPIPVGHTTVSSSGQIYGHEYGSSHGTSNGTIFGDVNGHWYGNNASQSSYSGTAHYNNQVVATQTAYVPHEMIAFNKAIIIQIYDANAYKNSMGEKKVWQSIACNFDEDGDLRNSLDFLLIASLEYLGKDTQRFVSVSLRNNSKEIKDLRSSYLQPFNKYKKEQSQNIPSQPLYGKLTQSIKGCYSKLETTIKEKYRNFCERKKKQSRRHPRCRKKRQG